MCRYALRVLFLVYRRDMYHSSLWFLLLWYDVLVFLYCNKLCQSLKKGKKCKLTATKDVADRPGD